jgi:hypothetical protein
MDDLEQLNELIEILAGDRSPATDARRVGTREQQLMLMAQQIRGSRTRGPDPAFVARLHNILQAVDRSNAAPERVAKT